MPATPWTTVAPLDDHHQYVIMATRFAVSSRRHLPRVFNATRPLWTQLPSADGLMGYTMQASLLRGTLSTLSVWRDDEALRAFVRSAAHRSTAAGTRRWMSSSTFADWTAAGADLPPPWSTAERHLASSRTGHPTTATQRTRHRPTSPPDA
jgi:heme-degrading monooxygenase HmoA